MPAQRSSSRHSDGSIKWLIGATLLAIGGLGFFLMYIASEIRNAGPSGAVSLGVVAAGGVLAFGAVVLGPIGRGVGTRLMAGTTDPGEELGAEVHDLRLQTEDLRNALADAQERIDFAERMLAGGKESVTEELH